MAGSATCVFQGRSNGTRYLRFNFAVRLLYSRQRLRRRGLRHRLRSGWKEQKLFRHPFGNWLGCDRDRNRRGFREGRRPG